MKKLISLLLITLTYLTNFGQVHWLINSDSVPKCELIKSGKFVNKETNDKTTDGYYIIIKDGYATEYINDGQYYLKSKIEFKTACKYTSTVIEVTIPDYNIEPGTIISTEIISTSSIDNLIEIKSEINNDSYSFVLQKIK
jgi:hypothetical protein